MKVAFIQDYQNWKVKDQAELDPEVGERLCRAGVAQEIPQTKKPRNKKVKSDNSIDVSATASDVG